MRPLGKRGDVLSSERIYNGLFLLGMAPDNVTLSARLTAYASSGRVSVCEETLLKMMRGGLAPNGAVAAVVIKALTFEKRHQEAWSVFLHHGLQSGYLVKASSAANKNLGVGATLEYEFGSIGHYWKNLRESRRDTQADPLCVQEAVMAAMYCCMMGGLGKEAVSLIRAHRLAGHTPHGTLIDYAEKAKRREGQRRPE